MIGPVIEMSAVKEGRETLFGVTQNPKQELLINKAKISFSVQIFCPWLTGQLCSTKPSGSFHGWPRAFISFSKMVALFQAAGERI